MLFLLLRLGSPLSCLACSLRLLVLLRAWYSFCLQHVWQQNHISNLVERIQVSPKEGRVPVSFSLLIPLACHSCGNRQIIEFWSFG